MERVSAGTAPQQQAQDWQADDDKGLSDFDDEVLSKLVPRVMVLLPFRTFEPTLASCLACSFDQNREAARDVSAIRAY